ncbi:MAG: hypothetical protein R6V05_01995 [Candidatus Brocadiia bacterium]
MRRIPLIAVMFVLVVCLLGAASEPDESPPAEEAPPAPTEEQPEERERPAKAGDQREAIRREAAELGREAGKKAGEIARHADSLLERATRQRWVGWVAFLGALAVGLMALFYGWHLIQTFLIPFAPFWGLITGGSIAFCLIAAFYTQRDVWFRLLLFAVGSAFGFGLYLFSALRAKPVAAFLCIMSPFLMAAAFLFPVHDKVALAIFAVGFLAGFAAMIEVRPLAVVSTSIFGACSLLVGLGLLSHLVAERADWVRDAFTWLMDNPLIALVAWLVIAFAGSNFQFMTGPRGGLED